MNYNKFIPYYYKLDIKDKYTLDGWYLLNYLLCYAQDGIFIKTNLDILYHDLNMSKNKLVFSLLHLQENKILDIDTTNMRSKVLNITLNFNEAKGFKAVPIDYIKPLLSQLKPKELSILTILIIYYNYIQPVHENGNYKLMENNCTFISVRKISELTGIGFKTIIMSLTKLEELNLIHKVSKGVYTAKGTKEVNRYDIPLLSSIEYKYHRYVNVNASKKYLECKELLENISFDKLRNTSNNTKITTRNYIEYKYHKELKKFFSL